MKQRPKNFYAEIAVAPEDVARLKKGCKRFDMTCERVKGGTAFSVGVDDISALYWLGANMFGHIEETTLTRRSF